MYAPNVEIANMLLNRQVLSGAILLMVTTAQASGPAGQDSERVEDALTRAADTHTIPYPLLRAICMVESNLDARAYHADDNGSASYGMCQVKLRTARWMGYKGPSSRLFNPKVNAEIAARYIKYLLRRYHSNVRLSVSAYNAGHVMYWNKKLVNENYVRKVMRVYQRILLEAAEGT